MPHDSAAQPNQMMLDLLHVHPFVRAEVHDRILGTLFGAALGDAIGIYTEFLPKHQANTDYPARSFDLVAKTPPYRKDTHRAPHRPGNWTDDTDHALCIVLQWLEKSKVEVDEAHGTGTGNAHDGRSSPPSYKRSPGVVTPHALAFRLSTWCQQGLRALDGMPLGLGRTVASVIVTAGYTTNPHQTAVDVWRKGGRKAAANGSLMRTHPVGLMCLHKSAEECFKMAAELSCVTHVDPRCVLACCIGSALIRGLVRGEVSTEEGITDTIAAARRWYNDVWVATMKERYGAQETALDGEFAVKDDEIDLYVSGTHELVDLKLDDGAMGYVLKCLSTGLILLRKTMRALRADGSMRCRMDIFQTLITDLIMEGGDADTNGCFAGSLLGSHLGYKALPPKWRDGLNHGEWLLNKAESVAIILGARDGTYDGRADKDNAIDGAKGLLSKDQMEDRWARFTAKVLEESGVLAKTQPKSGMSSFFGLLGKRAT
ncbi:ADP-ribosylglycohydrolase [Gonapodya prolifera JEL478]|uniref:ADP-ribosylglycohydrolase n=1 Tax=Gonapodya prolifera (strain JEL478) TaxID=1344416 RepID=A0A139AQC1_GONPJ|nr:ADP-ribosylglycohydrolase [Gonapodya prolifera JEL478]|eukprot:KXS18703.1 ADP-ribosylglycohydrolase [Gonapodya prolifera JEL478]